MPFVNVANDKIYYAERGAASADAPHGTPIVFIHGSGASHRVWGEQVRALGEITRAVALDLPGHGRSAPPGRATMEAYRDVVLGLLDALGLARAVIVGHSLGGGIAQTLALSHPDRVAGLGLIGTGARLRVLPQILDGILSPREFDQTVEFIVDHAYAPGLDAAARARARADLRACPPQVTHGDFAACNAFDVMTRLSDIRAPTVVICGRADQMTPVKYSEYLVAHIPNARLVVVEDASHSVMLEQPDAVNRALVEFMRTL
jgi:pimeloyl-ACP methyl ester carboxylesterase